MRGRIVGEKQVGESSWFRLEVLYTSALKIVSNTWRSQGVYRKLKGARDELFDTAHAGKLLQKIVTRAIRSRWGSIQQVEGRCV